MTKVEKILARVSEGDRLVSTICNDMKKLRDEIKEIVDDYTPKEDDPKVHRVLKSAMADINNAVNKLDSIKGS